MDVNAVAARSAPVKSGTFPMTIRTGKDRTNALVEDLKLRIKIDEFELQNVIPSGEVRTFRNSQGEAKAIYTRAGDTVTLTTAEYSSRTIASLEFGGMLGRERSRGARILSEPKFTVDAINAAFATDEKIVAFCNWPAGKRVLCHQLRSPSGAALTDFQDALSNAN